MAAFRFCEICKQEIEADRAAANAETRLCKRHAEEIKKYGGEFTPEPKEERTSKPGSIKINYGGGISVSLKRNTEGVERLRDDYLLEEE